MFNLLYMVFRYPQHIVVAFVYLRVFVFQYKSNRMSHYCNLMNSYVLKEKKMHEHLKKGCALMAKICLDDIWIDTGKGIIDCFYCKLLSINETIEIVMCIFNLFLYVFFLWIYLYAMHFKSKWNDLTELCISRYDIERSNICPPKMKHDK